MGPSAMLGSPAPKGALLSDKYAVGEELGRGAFGQVQVPHGLVWMFVPACIGLRVHLRWQ